MDVYYFVIHREYYNRQLSLANTEVQIRTNGLTLDERADLYRLQLEQRTAVRRFKHSNNALLSAPMPEIGKVQL